VPAPPLIVVDDASAYAAVVQEAMGAGWTLTSPEEASGPSALVAVTVHERADARAAVLLAVRGNALLVRANAERAIVDDLVEDLARIGPAHLVDGGRVVPLDAASWQLVHALADGSTVPQAARALHVSLRTANRRIADARALTGAQTRAQLLRLVTGPGRVPRAPSGP
jgi:hypothetical protein